MLLMSDLSPSADCYANRARALNHVRVATATFGPEPRLRTLTLDICMAQDYTMAQYRPETFEVLAYNLTVKQLVEKLGYPRVRHSLSLLATGNRRSLFVRCLRTTAMRPAPAMLQSQV